MIESKFLQDLEGKIFSQAQERTNLILSKHIRLAYYTTEETLMKIIKNKEIWLRSTSRMNDSMEIKYGLDELGNALSNNKAKFNFF